MTTLIKTLEIHGYRALNDLRIDGCGRVNVVTGKNNSGKSSLLEAIRILVTPSHSFPTMRRSRTGHPQFAQPRYQASTTAP